MFEMMNGFISLFWHLKITGLFLYLNRRVVNTWCGFWAVGISGDWLCLHGKPLFLACHFGHLSRSLSSGHCGWILDLDPVGDAGVLWIPIHIPYLSLSLTSSLHWLLFSSLWPCSWQEATSGRNASVPDLQSTGHRGGEGMCQATSLWRGHRLLMSQIRKQRVDRSWDQAVQPQGWSPEFYGPEKLLMPLS